MICCSTNHHCETKRTGLSLKSTRKPTKLTWWDNNFTRFFPLFTCFVSALKKKPPSFCPSMLLLGLTKGVIMKMSPVMVWLWCLNAHMCVHVWCGLSSTELTGSLMRFSVMQLAFQRSRWCPIDVIVCVCSVPAGFSWPYKRCSQATKYFLRNAYSQMNGRYNHWLQQACR